MLQAAQFLLFFRELFGCFFVALNNSNLLIAQFDDLLQLFRVQAFLVLPETFASDNMEMIGNIGPEAAEKQAEIWTQFKTLCGQ